MAKFRGQMIDTNFWKDVSNTKISDTLNTWSTCGCAFNQVEKSSNLFK